MFSERLSSLHSKSEHTSVSKTKAFLRPLRHSRKGTKAYIAFGRGLHIQSCGRVRDKSGEIPQDQGEENKKSDRTTRYGLKNNSGRECWGEICVTPRKRQGGSTNTTCCTR